MPLALSLATNCCNLQFMYMKKENSFTLPDIEFLHRLYHTPLCIREKGVKADRHLKITMSMRHVMSAEQT